ncbi:MAG: IclR family transcriptional regulator, partial [Acetobacter orientalis]
WCFGAGVKDYSGRMVAGVGVSLPQTDLARYDVAELGGRAVALAQAVSTRLGYRNMGTDSLGGMR